MADGHHPALGTQQPLGLRERKKAKTRASIREHAMRLFREFGYGETTVERIAEAAEVSPSTFFRYFPTKEDLVLADDYDPLLIAAFRAQPPELSVIQALRGALHEVFASLDELTLAKEAERYELMESVPDLRAAMYQEYRRSIGLIAGLIAERIGRDPADFEVNTFAGALSGVMMSVVTTPDGSPRLTTLSFQRVDEALAYLESGLPLN